MGWLCTASLSRPLNDSLWTQAFSLNVSVSTFWILNILAIHLVRAAMNCQFRSVFVALSGLELIHITKIDTCRTVHASRWKSTGWIHTHLKFSWDFEGTNLAEASLILICPCLLVTGCKFKSTTTSQLSTRASVSRLTSKHVTLGLFGYHRCIVKIIEHKVHILFCCGRQIGPIQVLVIFIDSDSNSALSDVTSGSRSFRQLFLIMKLSCS